MEDTTRETPVSVESVANDPYPSLLPDDSRPPTRIAPRQRMRVGGGGVVLAGGAHPGAGAD